MIELHIEAKDHNKKHKLWEARLNDGDEIYNVGGGVLVPLLDGEDGLITLIVRKIRSVWPTEEVRVTKCHIPQEAHTAKYLMETVNRLLVNAV